MYLHLIWNCILFATPIQIQELSWNETSSLNTFLNGEQPCWSRPILIPPFCSHCTFEWKLAHLHNQLEFHHKYNLNLLEFYTGGSRRSTHRQQYCLNPSSIAGLGRTPGRENVSYWKLQCVNAQKTDSFPISYFLFHHLFQRYQSVWNGARCYFEK